MDPVACSRVNFTFIIIIIIIIQEFPRSVDNSVMSQEIRPVCSFSTKDNHIFTNSVFCVMNGDDDQ
jgi:hypothetical protein